MNNRGDVFFKEAKQLIEAAAKIDALSGGKFQRPHTAKVVADEYIVEHMLRPTPPRFQRDHPDIQIHFSQINFVGDVIHELKSERTDLAYVTLWTLDADWPIDVISSIEVGLYVSPNHPIVNTWDKDPHRHLPLITPITGSGMEMVMNKSLIHAESRKTRKFVPLPA